MARGRKAFQTIENLLKNYQVDGKGCWVWQKQINNAGYGFFTFQYKSFLAHRASYILTNGKVPDGMVLDHICNTRTCINPAHLEPVTIQENAKRRGERQTHCKRGHELTEDNVYRASNGWRRCLKCTGIRLESSKVKETCFNCGKIFGKRKYDATRFCSRDCYWDYKRLKQAS